MNHRSQKRTTGTAHGPVSANAVKNKLARGESVIGVVISVNSVEVAVHAANLGFDFLWLEMEHTPLNLETVRNIVLATRGLPALPFARPPVNELWTAKRVLDAGVLGVIFPFTSTPELARQAVSACRYPPEGRRGSGAALAQVTWANGGNYYDFADENVLVVAVVEDATGLSHIDQIAATPGIDVLFIGTSDLSFSLGLRGRQDEPQLDAAVARIVTAAKRHHKVLGRPARTAADIKRFQKQGFRFFMTATDLELMTDGSTQLFEPLSRKRSVLSAAGL